MQIGVLRVTMVTDMYSRDVCMHNFFFFFGFQQRFMLWYYMFDFIRYGFLQIYCCLYLIITVMSISICVSFACSNVLTLTYCVYWKHFLHMYLVLIAGFSMSRISNNLVNSETVPLPFPVINNGMIYYNHKDFISFV